jgi:hypothetical protein
MPFQPCPATNGRHAFERDSDDFRSWVACVECGASPSYVWPQAKRPDKPELAAAHTAADWERMAGEEW